MAKFDLASYETVEERIKKFYSIYDDGRIVTECVVAGDDGKWLFKAFVYVTAGDQAAGLPKATGYASETDGGPQAEWKAELGETSSIGRALANMNLAAKRASREEMQKVERVENRDWLSEANKISNLQELRLLYGTAKSQRAPKSVLDKIQELANGYSASEHKGAK